MKNKPINKLDAIKLFRTFSDKELRRFSCYLESEYFSERKTLIILFNELQKYHPLYTDIYCTKEVIYKAVYPGSVFNGGTLRDLISDLYRAAINFLSVENYLKNNSGHYVKIKELRQRNLYKQADRLLSDHHFEIDRLNNIDSELFLHYYYMQVETVNLKILSKSYVTNRSVEALIDSFKKAEIYIKIYSLLEIFANYINLIIYEERYSKTESTIYIKRIIKEFRNSYLYGLADKENKYYFIIELYDLMLEAFNKRGNFGNYEKYCKYTRKHLAKLSSNEISFHYARLISCCILGAKYSKNKYAFNNELLSLYYNFLENGYYRNNKTRFIPSNLYRAVVLHAIKMNKLPWLFRIINKYTCDIQPTDRENMKQYALAYYYYALGYNGKSLEAIGTLNITQFIFKYDIYNLKLRIFYEEKDLVAAMELINTYRQFLRTDKMMPTARKLFHRNFMKYTRRLILISEGSKKFEAGLEIQKLQNEDCVYKEWLVEKLSLFDTSEKKYLKTG